MKMDMNRHSEMGDIDKSNAINMFYNPRSGAAMKQIGMKYCYSYKEQWQPKDFAVIFRMYHLNCKCFKTWRSVT